MLQIGLIECGDALENGLLSLLSGHIYIRKKIEIDRENKWREGRGISMNIVGNNKVYNTLRTLSGGQNDLLLSGGILQFLRVETLQLALQILGHLGQILECWCWCCWGCHLQEREREIKSNSKENKNKLCIFPLHLPITTQWPNNKNPDIDSGLQAITAVVLLPIKRKCASITQRSLLNLLTHAHIHTHPHYACVCVCGATFCVVYRFVFISCDFPW